MLKIAVGTKSKPKLKLLNDVLAEISVNASLFPFDVSSGVTHQPRTEKETRQGSINRARNALSHSTTAIIGLGVEVGYEPIEGKLFMHGVSSIIDRDGNIYSEQSSTLELPKYLEQFLHDHEDDGVGFHVQEYKDKSEAKSWRYFTEIIQYREPFIKESLRNVLLRYLYKDEY